MLEYFCEIASFMHTGDDIRNYLDVNVLLKMR